MPRSMQFEDLNWMDVEEYLEHDNRIIVTIGACEQHGYLSLLTDTKIPTAIANAVSEIEKVLMTPSLPYGVSRDFTAYPGTLSLQPSTFIVIVKDIIEGLLAQGFRKILINNGHGGNTGLLDYIATDLNSRYPDCRVGVFSWWYHPIVVKTIETTGFHGTHANWLENFSFTRVCSVPKETKEILTGDEWPRAASAADYRRFLGDGSFGGYYEVSDEIMERLFAAAVEAMLAELHLLDKVDRF